MMTRRATAGFSLAATACIGVLALDGATHFSAARQAPPPAPTPNAPIVRLFCDRIEGGGAAIAQGQVSAVADIKNLEPKGAPYELTGGGCTTADGTIIRSRHIAPTQGGARATQWQCIVRGAADPKSVAAYANGCMVCASTATPGYTTCPK
jgi:hypothetical protein